MPGPIIDAVPGSVGPYNYINVSAASSTTVKIGPGRLCSLAILAAGTATFTAYDSTTSGGSPQPIFISAATSPIATIYTCNIPVVNGIYISGQAGSPQILVTFN